MEVAASCSKSTSRSPGVGGADDEQSGCVGMGVDRVGFHGSGRDVGSEAPGGQVAVAGHESCDRFA